MNNIFLILILLNFSILGSSHLERLNQTKLLNLDHIIDELKLESTISKSFKYTNPYQPYYFVSPETENEYLVEENGIESLYRKRHHSFFYGQESVAKWSRVQWRSTQIESVCALKFIDEEKKEYHLKNFTSAHEAKLAGYKVTHYGHCGMCSSLKDLYVYLKKRNLVTESADCSKKILPINIKECYQKTIGFTESCAEIWAYSSLNSRKNCLKICAKEYGLVNILKGNFLMTSNNEDGSLKRCVLCDEIKSGASFVYGAGRNRRLSGIVSAIERDESEIYEVDHDTYFED